MGLAEVPSKRAQYPPGSVGKPEQAGADHDEARDVGDDLIGGTVSILLGGLADRLCTPC